MDSQENILDKNDRLKTLVDEMYSNAVLHHLSAGMSLLSEIIIYLVSAGCIFFAFIMHRVFPFHVLGDIVYKRELIQYFSVQELKTFEYAVRGLVVLIAILLMYIGLQMRAYRKRKVIIFQTANKLKKIYEEEIKALKNTENDKEGILNKIEPHVFTL